MPMKRFIETSTIDELFDLCQQMMDDTRNKNFKNGFIVYYNNGKFHMASTFENPHMMKTAIVDFTEKLNQYMNTILTIRR